MKQRHLRAGDQLADDEVIVVRGGALDRDRLREDATRYFSIYGTYGVSVFAARRVTVEELAQEPPLVRFGSSLLSGSEMYAFAVSGSSRRVATIAISRWRGTSWRQASRGSSAASTRPGATLTMKTEMADRIELVADLNAEDDDGLGWSTLADAPDPERVRPGAMLLAGNSAAQAVVRVVAVDDDGQVHFTILPGSVAKNRHLLGRTVA